MEAAVAQTNDQPPPSAAAETTGSLQTGPALSVPGPRDLVTEAEFQELVVDASGAALNSDQDTTAGRRDYPGWLVAGAAVVGLIAVGAVLVAYRKHLLDGLLDLRTWDRITTHKHY